MIPPSFSQQTFHSWQVPAVKRLSRLAILSTCCYFLLACDNQTKVSGEVASSTSSNVIATPTEPSLPKPPEQMDMPQSQEEALCVHGVNLVNNAKKDDFSYLLGLICQNNKTTDFFNDLLTNAYQGTGDQKIEMFKYEATDNFIVTLGTAFSMKLPAESPAVFGDKNPHEIFANGVIAGNSKMVAKVTAREALPGRYTVERIMMNYDVHNASGAGVYDNRDTEINIYIPFDDYRDVTISTEHLLSPEKNQYTHSLQNLTIGWKGEAGHSYLISISEVIMKNRIDPPRAKSTVGELNLEVSQMLYGYLAK